MSSYPVDAATNIAAKSLIFPAATRLRHAVSRRHKLLTSQRMLRLSLQSIIGAT